MRPTLAILRALSLVICFALLSACGGSSGGDSTPPDTTSLGIILVDGDSQAIADAQLVLQMAGRNEQVLGQTNNEGGAEANGLPIDTEFSIAFEKAGYTDQVLHFEALSKDVDYPNQRVVMLERAAPIEFEADEAADLLADAGARLTVGADAFVDANGDPVTGMIEARITPVDVSDSSTVAEAFPGSFIGRTDEDEEENIVTYGTTEFVFTDENGNALQLAEGKTADIELPIFLANHPDGSLIEAGDRIPLWHLNEDTGIWEQEGEGTVVVSASSPTGFALQASVSHFSWWNVDVVPDTGRIEITLIMPPHPDRNYRVTLTADPQYNRLSRSSQTLNLPGRTISETDHPVFTSDAPANVNIYVNASIERRIEVEGQIGYVKIGYTNFTAYVAKDETAEYQVQFSDSFDNAQPELEWNADTTRSEDEQAIVEIVANQTRRTEIASFKHLARRMGLGGIPELRILNNSLKGEAEGRMRLYYSGADSLILEGTPLLSDGTYLLEFEVEDFLGNTLREDITVRVLPPPTLALAPNTVTLTIGETLNWSGATVEDGIAPYKFQIQSVSSFKAYREGFSNLRFEHSTGNMTGQAAAEIDDLELQIIAIDASDNVSEPQVLLVNVLPLPPAVANSSASEDYLSQENVNLDLNQLASASGVIDQWVTADTLPAGLNLDSQSGVIVGQSTQIGRHILNFEARNRAGSTSFALTLQINPPAILARNNTDLDLSAWFMAPLNGTPFQLQGELPNGLTFDTNSGRLTGSATESGEFSLVVSQAGGEQIEFTLTVNQVNTAPQIQNVTPNSVSPSSITTISVQSFDAELDSLTTIITLQSSISGVSLEEDNGTYQLIVSEQVSVGETITLAITVSDEAGLSEQRSHDIVVTQGSLNGGLLLPNRAPFSISRVIDSGSQCYALEAQDEQQEVLTWNRNDQQWQTNIKQIDDLFIYDLVEHNGRTFWVGSLQYSPAFGEIVDNEPSEIALPSSIDLGAEDRFGAIGSNGSILVAATSRNLYYSDDLGQTWEAANLPSGNLPGNSYLTGNQTIDLKDIAYANGEFVAVGSKLDLSGFNTLAGALVLSSADGINWNEAYYDGNFLVNGPHFAFGNLRSVVYDNASATWLAAGDPSHNGSAFVTNVVQGTYSNNASSSTWSLVSSLNSTTSFNAEHDIPSVAYDANRGWLLLTRKENAAAGNEDNNWLFQSSDLTTWQAVTLAQDSRPLNVLGQCDDTFIYGNDGRTVAVEENQLVELATEKPLQLANFFAQGSNLWAVEAEQVMGNGPGFYIYPRLTVHTSTDGGNTWQSTVYDEAPGDNDANQAILNNIENAIQLDDGNWAAEVRDFNGGGQMYYSSNLLDWEPAFDNANLSENSAITYTFVGADIYRYSSNRDPDTGIVSHSLTVSNGVAANAQSFVVTMPGTTPYIKSVRRVSEGVWRAAVVNGSLFGEGDSYLTWMDSTDGSSWQTSSTICGSRNGDTPCTSDELFYPNSLNISIIDDGSLYLNRFSFDGECPEIAVTYWEVSTPDQLRPVQRDSSKDTSQCYSQERFDYSVVYDDESGGYLIQSDEVEQVYLTANLTNWGDALSFQNREVTKAFNNNGVFTAELKFDDRYTSSPYERKRVLANIEKPDLRP